MEPADPHNLHDTADHAVIDLIQIATAGNECDECVLKLRDPLMQIQSVQDVKADPGAGYVTITFDRRRTQAAELHETSLQSGYQAAPLAG